MRRSVRAARVELRRPTSRLRVLPDFLLIGAQRCGTTSLYRWLASHPQVAPPLRKEIQYFTLNAERGEAWYRAHFPARAGDDGRPLTFEATPYYLFHPLAPARAAAAVASARLVVLVRNPVDRAFSHWRHNRARGTESLDFEAALAEEPRRLRGEVERMLGDPTYRSRAHQLFSYASRGLYAEQLERWFAHFPRQQVLVVRSEDLYRRSEETFSRVLSFLALPEAPLRAEPAPAGPGSREGTALPVDVRRRVAEEFRPANLRLAELLGQDPGWDE